MNSGNHESYKDSSYRDNCGSRRGFDNAHRAGIMDRNPRLTPHLGQLNLVEGGEGRVNVVRQSGRKVGQLNW